MSATFFFLIYELGVSQSKKVAPRRHQFRQMFFLRQLPRRPAKLQLIEKCIQNKYQKPKPKCISKASWGKLTSRLRRVMRGDCGAGRSRGASIDDDSL